MRAALAPTLGWTHKAALGLAAVGLVVPGISVFELFADRGCRGDWTPHYLEGIALTGLAGAIAYGAVLVHRRVARWVRRGVRVRSKLAGAAVSAMTLLPTIALGVGSAALAGWFYFTYAFHICLNFESGNGLPLFGWQGC